MKVTVKTEENTPHELLTKKPAIVIGRSPTCDLPILDDFLSRKHAMIEFDGDNFFVTDLGSSNGVYLNGERIPANVRTTFNSYFDLMIGRLKVEVSPEDPDAKSSNFIPFGHVSTKSSETTPFNKAPGPVKKDKPPRLPSRKPAKRNTGVMISAVIFFAVIGALIFQIFTGGGGTPHGVAPKADQLNVPEPLKKIPNQFLSKDQYKRIQETASCADFEELCKQMKLKPDQGEGITLQEREYYLYLIPAQRAGDPAFKRIPEEERDTFIAVTLLMQSKMFIEFQEKKVGQLHLVLLTSDQNFKKVLRFHAKKFANEGPERMRLISAIYTATTTGQTKDFFRLARRLIQIKEF